MAFAQVGKVAPAFTLLDQRGNKVSLKQFRDVKNVVLYFYPKAMTPGCTVQAWPRKRKPLLSCHS